MRKLLLTAVPLLVLFSCSTKARKREVLTGMLYEALAASNKTQADDNARAIQKMVRELYSAKHSGGPMRQWLADAETISDQTQTVMDSLRKARLQLRRYARQKDGQDAAVVMLGIDKQGVAYNLLEAVNVYSAELGKLDKNLKPLVLLPEMEANHADIEAVAQFYFEGVSIPEAFAGLAHIEARILEYEREITQLVGARGCILEIKHDAVSAFAGSNSTIVAAGDTYQAEMMLIATFPEIKQMMTVNGRPIEIVNGKGRVEFVADGKGLESQDSIKKNWIGTIGAYWQGTDTRWTVRVPYTVVRKRK